METLQSIAIDEFDTVFNGVPQTGISRGDWDSCPNVLDLMSTVTNAEIYPSKSEARRALQQNAVSINKVKVASVEQSLTDFQLLQDRFILVSKGKKNHLIRIN